MPRFDMALDELRDYRPAVAEPDDFDAFWQRTLDESRALGDAPVVRRVESPLRAAAVHDVTFPGFGGEPVSGWLLLPTDIDGPVPAVVEYVGYGGGRGLAHERLAWVASGYAHLVMDTRGQGSSWGSGGVTPDPHGSKPAASGYMTRGIEEPDTYYYRRVFTDAVRAVDAVRTFAEVDAERVVVTGGSQGGGIAIAAAALSEGIFAAMPDVPFLCHFARAVGMTDRDPYQEIVRYLAVHREQVDAVFATLSYFDGVNFARRATAPALFSAALLDPICPPSTVYAARNHWGGPARIVDYHFNEHEGGAGHQWVHQAAFLAGLRR